MTTSESRPSPPAWRKLSAPLEALADFLRVDEDLLEVAAAASTGEAAAAPSRAEMARWVKALPAAEKDAYLVRFLAEEGDIPLRAELAKRFREATAPRGRGPCPLRRATDRRPIARGPRSPGRGEDPQGNRESGQGTRHAASASRRRRGPSISISWPARAGQVAGSRAVDRDQASQGLRPGGQPCWSTCATSPIDPAGPRRPRSVSARLRERHANKPSLLKRFDERKLGG